MKLLLLAEPVVVVVGGKLQRWLEKRCRMHRRLQPKSLPKGKAVEGQDWRSCGMEDKQLQLSKSPRGGLVGSGQRCGRT